MNQHNGKIEFVYQYGESDPKVTMTLAPETALPQVLEAFELFLIAAGYKFDGIVDIVPADYSANPEQN